METELYNKSRLRRETGLFNQIEAAEILGLSPPQLNKLIKAGTIPAPTRVFRDMKTKFFNQSDLDSIKQMFGH